MWFFSPSVDMVHGICAVELRNSLCHRSVAAARMLQGKERLTGILAQGFKSAVEQLLIYKRGITKRKLKEF